MGPAATCLRSSYVSVARLNAFRQCPLGFKLKYIDGRPSSPSREAQRGTLIHAVIAHWLQQIRGVDAEHPALVDSLLQLVGPVSRTLRQEGRLTAKFALSEIRPLLQNFAKLIPSIAGRAISEVESTKQTLLTSGSDRWIFRSVLDLVVEDSAGSKAIIDFKTGSARYVTPFQLRAYALPVLGSPEYAKQRVDLIYVHLKEGRINRWLMCRDECQGVVREIITAIREIESALRFPARVSRLCPWCDVRRFCPEA